MVSVVRITFLVQNESPTNNSLETEDHYNEDLFFELSEKESNRVSPWHLLSAAGK